MSIPIETERKYIIKMPDEAELLGQNGCVSSKITQIYILSEKGATERIRKRKYSDKIVYTHTVKRRISAMSSFEDEEEISRERYFELKLKRDREKHKIKKTRYAMPFNGHIIEIDVYPFWSKQAIMEIELKSEDESFTIPSFISVIREVTGDKKYSNNSLSKKIPSED